MLNQKALIFNELIQLPDFDKLLVHEKLKQLFPTFDNTKLNENNQVEIRNTLEISFRTFFNDYIKKFNSTQDVNKAIRLSSIVVELGYLDAIIEFQIFEDLFDGQPISRAIELFSLLEMRKDILAQDASLHEKGRKKNLFLKVCIELLKRLSRTTNPDSCGRILIFLANVFPLSDPSGLNTKGEHNTHNEIFDSIDKSLKDAGEYSDQAIDFKFYRDFWSLQRVFQSPQSLLQFPAQGQNPTNIPTLIKSKWDSFIESLDLVLNAFSTLVNLDELVVPDKIQINNKKLNNVDIEMTDKSNSSSNSNSNNNNKHYFCTKYLTNPNLMELQLKDSTFRRNILTQVLITFQYYEVSSMKFPNLFTSDQKQLQQNLISRIYKILLSTQPDGEFFSNSISNILKREKNWIYWKRDFNCKSFEKPALDTSALLQQQQQSGRLDKKRKFTPVMGHSDLAKIWKSSQEKDLKTTNTVTIESLMAPLIKENEEIEAQEKKEREKQQRRKTKELEKKKKHDERLSKYELEKQSNPNLPPLEDSDEDVVIDSDDLEDLDDPKPLLKEDSVYVWKTLRCIGKKRLELFRCSNFDDIIQNVNKPSISSPVNKSRRATIIDNSTPTTPTPVVTQE
ncbi:putative THO1 protein [Tieghemostelium lacteum]|uniref:Putative THO1 protein n=1 Tax=Tieghemostelium lacteum TaxID=361077 RepID=A0A152A9L9_TIELA|nr:putative THO1 protein [Tieghemostelium lacteum]|eukprot:KYR02918.1 putative THO1 protein [Tieghemostelium lacteum]